MMPWTSSVDVRVAKRFDLGGRAQLDLMADLFKPVSTGPTTRR